MSGVKAKTGILLIELSPGDGPCGGAGRAGSGREPDWAAASAGNLAGPLGTNSTLRYDVTTSRPGGEIGRRTSLRCWRAQALAGSNHVPGTFFYGSTDNVRTPKGGCGVLGERLKVIKDFGDRQTPAALRILREANGSEMGGLMKIQRLPYRQPTGPMGMR